MAGARRAVPGSLPAPMVPVLGAAPTPTRPERSRPCGGRGGTHQGKHDFLGGNRGAAFSGGGDRLPLRDRLPMPPRWSAKRRQARPPGNMPGRTPVPKRIWRSAVRMEPWRQTPARKNVQRSCLPCRGGLVNHQNCGGKDSWLAWSKLTLVSGVDGLSLCRSRARRPGVRISQQARSVPSRQLKGPPR
jgi:hypothetical protein